MDDLWQFAFKKQLLPLRYVTTYFFIVTYICPKLFYYEFSTNNLFFSIVDLVSVNARLKA